MQCYAVMGEQGVQERAQNAPLWGPSVEDQRGWRCCFLPSPPGGVPSESPGPVAQGGVETQELELNDEFGGYYGVKY